MSSPKEKIAFPQKRNGSTLFFSDGSRFCCLLLGLFLFRLLGWRSPQTQRKRRGSAAGQGCGETGCQGPGWRRKRNQNDTRGAQKGSQKGCCPGRFAVGGSLGWQEKGGESVMIQLLLVEPASTNKTTILKKWKVGIDETRNGTKDKTKM